MPHVQSHRVAQNNHLNESHNSYETHEPTDLLWFRAHAASTCAVTRQLFPLLKTALAAYCNITSCQFPDNCNLKYLLINVCWASFRFTKAKISTFLECIWFYNIAWPSFIGDFFNYMILLERLHGIFVIFTPWEKFKLLRPGFTDKA